MVPSTKAVNSGLKLFSYNDPVTNSTIIVYVRNACRNVKHKVFKGCNQKEAVALWIVLGGISFQALVTFHFKETILMMSQRQFCK